MLAWLALAWLPWLALRPLLFGFRRRGEDPGSDLKEPGLTSAWSDRQETAELDHGSGLRSSAEVMASMLKKQTIITF